MARSVKKRSLKRGGGNYGNLGPAQGAPYPKRGGARKSNRRSKKRQTLTRKQKRSRKRESFLSTLNQMGGFIRDGSTQFFKLVSGV